MAINENTRSIREVHRCIKENPYITREELAQKTGLTEAQIVYALGQLEMLGWINKTVDSKRFVHYVSIAQLTGTINRLYRVFIWNKHIHPDKLKITSVTTVKGAFHGR